MKREPIAILVGGVIVLILTDGGDGAAFRELTQGEVYIRWEDLSQILWHATLGAFSLITQVVSFVLACFFVTTFAGTVERVFRSGRGQAADLLNARGRFGNQVLASLLGGGILGLAALPFWLLQLVVAWVGSSLGAPWLAGLGLVVLLVVWIPVLAYVYLGLRFVAQSVALEGLGPVESIRRSWELVDGHRFQLAIYLIVVNIFSILGLLACGIGVFVTGAIKATAINESYLQLITPRKPYSGSTGSDQGESAISGRETDPELADSEGSSATPA